MRNGERPLPPNWKWATVAQLAAKEPNSITDGPFGSKLKTAHYTESGPRVIRLQNIGDGVFVDARANISEEHFATLQKHRALAGDLIIAALGENPPRSCIVPEWLGPAIVKADCIRLRTASDVSAKFVNFALNSEDTRKRTRKIAHGVGRPRLNLSEIKSIAIPLPPLDEQQCIVAEIEKQFTRLDAGVASLKRMQSTLKRYRASALKAAFKGDWPRTRVTDVATDVRYGTSAKTNSNSDGVPVLRMGNISGGRLLLDKLKYLPKSHAEFPDLLLERGDVLFNRTNSAELVGKTAVYGGRPEPCSFASYLIRVRLRDEYSPDFLSSYLNSIFGRQWIASVVSQQVGQANVNGTKLKALEIPNPPLADQTRIVAEVERRLSVVEELDAVVSANLQRATRLRQSILQKAFSGAL